MQIHILTEEESPESVGGLSSDQLTGAPSQTYRTKVKQLSMCTFLQDQKR